VVLEVESFVDSIDEYLCCDGTNFSVTEIQELDHKKFPFSMFFTNCQSAYHKMPIIEKMNSELHTFTFDVLGFCETWYNSSRPAYVLDGYHCLETTRLNTRGGGVCIYAKNCYNLLKVHELCEISPDIELVTAAVDKKLIVSVCYRPPNGNTDNFLTALKQLFEYASNAKFNLVLMGDYNIDLCKDTNTSGELKNLIRSYGLCITSRQPTRYSTRQDRQISASCIDYIVSSFLPETFVSGPLQYPLSDHLPLVYFGSYHGHKAQGSASSVNRTIKTRRYSKSNLQRFCAAVRQQDWSDVYDTSDVNVCYSTIDSHLKKHYDLSFPLVQFKIPERAKHPWMTNDLLKLIDKKNHIFAEFQKSGSSALKDIYKHLEREVKRKVRYARRCYETDNFEKCNGNISKTFAHINRLLGREKHAKHGTSQSLVIDGNEISGKDLANRFNTYFAEVGNVKTNITYDHTYMPNIDTSGQRFRFKAATPNYVANVIHNLQNNCAAGLDGLKAGPLKAVSDVLCGPITHLVNLCFRTQSFPDGLKEARVTILHKKGDKNMLSNYRPISVLKVLSKVLEKCISQQLYEYFESTKLFVNEQFGFRRQKSTELALLSAKEYILSAFKENQYVLGIFIDIQKAFDSLKHNILVRKLQHYNVDVSAINLISSYLSNRKQQVVLAESSSEFTALRFGVPQGSILGPLLFLIYINDVVNVLPRKDNATTIMYADDTNYLLKGQEARQLEQWGQQTLDNISDWAERNGLIVNKKKTEAIVFQAKNKTVPSINLYFEGHKIDFVDNVRFLGVYFSRDLSWNYHVNNALMPKLACITGILRRIQYLIPLRVHKLIYYSLFHSHLYYCLLVHGTCGKTLTDKLHSMQKRLVRIMFNLPSDYPSTLLEPYIRRMDLVRVTNLYDYKLLRSIHVSCKANEHYLSMSNLKLHEPSKYETRNSQMYVVPFTKREYGRQSIEYRLPAKLNDVQEFDPASRCSPKALKELLKILLSM
jgi:exonuclease III